MKRPRDLGPLAALRLAEDLFRTNWPTLEGGEAKVWGALLALTILHRRHKDQIGADQIARLAGVKPKSFQKAWKHLVAKGLVFSDGCKGRRKLATRGLQIPPPRGDVSKPENPLFKVGNENKIPPSQGGFSENPYPRGGFYLEKDPLKLGARKPLPQGGTTREPMENIPFSHSRKENPSSPCGELFEDLGLAGEEVAFEDLGQEVNPPRALGDSTPPAKVLPAGEEQTPLELFPLNLPPPNGEKDFLEEALEAGEENFPPDDLDFPEPRQVAAPQAKKNGGDFWAAWIDANRRAGRKDPAKLKPDTGQGPILAGVIPPEKIPEILDAYLADADLFLKKQGHPLRLLPGRLNKYLNGHATDDDDDDPLYAEGNAMLRRLGIKPNR